MKSARPKTMEMSSLAGAFDVLHSIVFSPPEHRLMPVLVQKGEKSRHDLDYLIGAEGTNVLLCFCRKRVVEISMIEQRFDKRDGKATDPNSYSQCGKDMTPLTGLLNSELAAGL